MFKVCSATQAEVKDERMFDVLQPEFCKVTAEFWPPYRATEHIERHLPRM